MKKRNEKGFTLVEVIISIAIVALASTVIIQLFFVAGLRNQRTKVTDIALMQSQQILEKFKMAASPDEAVQSIELNWTETQNGYQATQYFSEKGELLPGAENAKFKLDAVISHMNPEKDVVLPKTISGKEMIQTALYRLDVQAILLIRPNSKEQVVNIGTQKLFTWLNAEGGAKK